MANEQAAANEQANAEQHFAIQRIYVKDLSFEAPATPEVFQSGWKPEMHLDIQTRSRLIEPETHEVVLTLTVEVKNEGKSAFLTEVQQAGIFTVKGIPKEHMDHTLKSFCPSVLYPYAREVVTDVVMRGGFPQLVLAPINFEAYYTQQLEQEKQETTEKA